MYLNITYTTSFIFLKKYLAIWRIDVGKRLLKGPDCDNCIHSVCEGGLYFFCSCHAAPKEIAEILISLQVPPRSLTMCGMTLNVFNLVPS